MDPLVDRFGRRHDTLRVSVTDRCNLRCRYCMPAEGVECRPRGELLSFEAITRVVSVARSLGVDRVRLTGGEPLVRRGLPDLIRMLDETVDLADLSLTTNGMLLGRKAEALAAAGLDRVNVSVDSLDPQNFEELTRHGDLGRVWSGIREAIDAGLEPLKVNVLVLRDFNVGEFAHWLELTEDAPLTVRFMELMPIGEANNQALEKAYVDLTEKRREWAERFDLEPTETEIGNGPARYWQAPGADGKVGFITPRSNPYCDGCSRLRISSTGEIRPCLAFDREVGLPEDLEQAPREAIGEALRAAVDQKPRGHAWQDSQKTDVAMSSIGG